MSEYILTLDCEICFQGTKEDCLNYIKRLNGNKNWYHLYRVKEVVIK